MITDGQTCFRYCPDAPRPVEILSDCLWCICVPHSRCSHLCNLPCTCGARLAPAASGRRDAETGEGDGETDPTPSAPNQPSRRRVAIGMLANVSPSHVTGAMEHCTASSRHGSGLQPALRQPEQHCALPPRGRFAAVFRNRCCIDTVKLSTSKRHLADQCCRFP